MTVTTNNQTTSVLQQQEHLEMGVEAMTSKSPLPAAVIDIPRDIIKTFPHTKRVGSYLIGKTLGEGSFAKVKEGLHYPTAEKVAIKVVDKKRAKEDIYVRRNMRREGKILQQVEHPNIVSLYEIMETENSYYLVTELCRGGEFMEYICRRKSLEEAEVRRYMRQIISAVDYLHRLGIMHRDLKVENLLLDENHDIKIIDFGLSNSFRCAAAGNDRASNLFRPDEVLSTQCGSPAYAAPELLGKKRYGPPADVWSIGVNMYAMLTGNLPFTVEPFNIKALHYKMLNGDMNVLPDRVSKDCKDFLKRILNPDPEKRMKLTDAMKHPWLTEGRTKPLEPPPRHSKLLSSDMDERILYHMSENQGYKTSDVIKFVSSNVPCATGAMYKFWQSRLDRSNEQQQQQHQQQKQAPSQQQKHTKEQHVEHQVKQHTQQKQKPQHKQQQPPKAVLPLTTKTSKITNPTQKLPAMLQGEAFVAPGVRVSINKDGPVKELTSCDLSPPVAKKSESSNKPAPDIGLHVNTIEMLPRPRVEHSEKPLRPVKSSALVRRALHAMRVTSREDKDTRDRRKASEPDSSPSNDSNNMKDVASTEGKPEQAPDETADTGKSPESSIKPSPMPFPFMTIPAPKKHQDDAQSDAPAQASQINNITEPETHTGMHRLDNYRDWSHLGTNKMLPHRNEQGQTRMVIVSNKNTLPKGTANGSKYVVAKNNLCLNDLNKDTGSVNNKQQSRLDQQRTSYSSKKPYRSLASRMSAPPTRMRRHTLIGSEQGEPIKSNNPFMSPSNGYAHSNLVEKAEKLLNNLNNTLDYKTNKAKSNNIGPSVHSTVSSSNENAYLNRLSKKLIDVTLAPYVPRIDPKIMNDTTSGSLHRKPEVDSGIELGHLSATRVAVAERHRGDPLDPCMATVLVNDQNNNVYGVAAFPVTMFKKTDGDSEPTSDLSLSPFTPPDSMNESKSSRSGGSRSRSTHSRINGTYDLILPTLPPQSLLRNQ